MVFNTTQDEIVITDEQKIARAKKKILQQFIAVKEAIVNFDSVLDEVLTNNPQGLTQQQVLSAFTAEQIQELNSIKTNLKAEADKIVRQ